MDTAAPLVMGIAAVKDSPPQSIIPEAGFAVFVLYVLWQVLDRHVLQRRGGAGPDAEALEQLRGEIRAHADSHALHERETTESLAILRSMKSKLDELVILTRDK